MATVNSCGLALLGLVSIAYGQDYPGPSAVFHPNQEIRVNGLPSLRAESKDASDVLATSLATVLNDKDVCCERDSALEDRLPQSDPVSLKEVAAKLQGRQLLSDGRPILVSAEYLAPDSVSAGQVIRALMDHHAPLMEWNSRVYVVYGAVFDEALYSDGSRTYVIHKFLLLDTRFSDSRRNVSFNRDTEDLDKVQGMLFLTVAAK